MIQECPTSSLNPKCVMSEAHQILRRELKDIWKGLLDILF